MAPKIFNTSTGMLVGPIDFEESRFKIISLTSTAVTGEKKIKSAFLFVKNSVGDLGMQ